MYSQEKRSSVLLTQSDNQYPINLEALTTIINVHSSFFKKLILPDAPLMNNHNLYVFFLNKPEWLSSNIFKVCLRDTCSSMRDLFLVSKENKMYGLLEDESFIRLLEKMEKIPIDFSNLSTHYTNRIDEAINDDKTMTDFGFNDQFRSLLTKALLEEFSKKGFVTRTTSYNLGDNYPNQKEIFRRFGDAYYWEGIPAVLNSSASVSNFQQTPTELVSSAIDSYLEHAIFLEESEIEFPVINEFYLLTLEDIKTLRKLESFHLLNNCIDETSSDPSDEELRKLKSKFLIHAQNITGYIAKKKKSPSNLAIIKSRISRDSRLKWYNVFVAGISLIPSITATISSAALSLGLSLIKSSDHELREERALYKRISLKSSSNETNPEFKVRSIINEHSNKDVKLRVGP